MSTTPTATLQRLGRISIFPVISTIPSSRFGVASARSALVLPSRSRLYVVDHFPDSKAAAIYKNLGSAVAGDSGIATINADGDSGYYSYVYNPDNPEWQVVSIIDPDPIPEDYYAEWSVPAQSASGSLDLPYTVSVDKMGLATREKVDGTVFDIEPVTKSGSIAGGNWSIAPDGKQTVTTAGHLNDDSFHKTGGAASASWSVHYTVTCTTPAG